MGRTCPECGHPFSLSDYIFEIDEVYYHCPDCNNGIAGDDSKGKPSNLPNTCKSCQKVNTLEDFIIRPAHGYDLDVDGLQLPIRTLDGNMFTRYFSTVWLIMTNPKTAMARVPSQEPLSYACKFYMQTLLILFIVAMIPNMLFFGFMPRIGTTGIGVSEIVLLIAPSFAMIVFACIFIVVFGLVSHALIHTTGEHQYPLKRTMQAVLYGGGASIAGLVPCCGGFIGFSWWMVASTNMFIRGQRISNTRAISASLTSLFFIVLCSCGTYLLMVAVLVMPAISQARIKATSVQQVQLVQQHQLLRLQQLEQQNALTPEEQVELDLMTSEMYGETIIDSQSE